MGVKTIDHYIENADIIRIPDDGLGEFIVGFTQASKSFNWTNSLWNLLPGVGQLFFVGHTIKNWLVKSSHDRVLLYKNGFIKQVLDGKGGVRKESVFYFDQLNGVLLEKTRQYHDIYGVGKYNATNVQFSVLDKNNEKAEVLSGSYRNAKDLEGNYNFIGHTGNAINDAWRQFVINKLKVG